MQAKEITKVDYSTNIFFGKVLERCGDGKISFVVDYPKITKAIPNPMVTVTIKKLQPPDERVQRLMPGDTLFMDHEVNINAVSDITKNHVFPITFKMDGQEYKLNRTKQNKLILTK